jgi:ABC-type multidrug transport system ATPase subunit
LIDGLVCEGLTKEYAGSKGKKALVDVGLKIPSEGIFSLIGMNGAGKTTLVRILATHTAKIGTCRGRDSWS